MIFAETVQRCVLPKTGTARELQLRLYHEIGIAAVAAELAVREKRPEPGAEPEPAVVPQWGSGGDLAA